MNRNVVELPVVRRERLFEPEPLSPSDLQSIAALNGISAAPIADSGGFRCRFVDRPDWPEADCRDADELLALLIACGIRTWDYAG